MRLKAFNPTLEGFETFAEITTEHSASSYGQPVLVIGTGELLGQRDALGTADVAFADYRILEATDEERAALSSAGYVLPDATPEECEALAFRLGLSTFAKLERDMIDMKASGQEDQAEDR